MAERPGPPDAAVARPEGVPSTRQRLETIGALCNIDPNTFSRERLPQHRFPGSDGTAMTAGLDAEKAEKLLDFFLHIEDEEIRALAIDLVLSVSRTSLGNPLK